MARNREKENSKFEKFKNRLSWFFYGLTQPLFAKINGKKSNVKDTKSSVRRRELIFYAVFISLPILQFLVFYVYVNMNSFVMAFRKFDSVNKTYFWVGLENINHVFRQISLGGNLRNAIFNSLIVYGLDLCMLPLQVFLPYYIYKKMPGAGFFKVMLFLPSILSAMVLGLMYISVMDKVVPETFEKFGVQVPMLLSGGTGNSRIISVWSFSAIFGFSSVLMYTGAMSRIPESVVEYAKLDGVSPTQEFFKITLPLILPTIMVYITTGIAGIFTNQVNLYTFFNSGSTVHTVGYYIFIKTLTSTGYSAYPEVAATGLIFSCIATPVMLIIRNLVMKYDPEAEY